MLGVGVAGSHLPSFAVSEAKRCHTLLTPPYTCVHHPFPACPPRPLGVPIINGPNGEMKLFGRRGSRATSLPRRPSRQEQINTGPCPRLNPELDDVSAAFHSFLCYVEHCYPFSCSCGPPISS